jgi:hypothetical protein
VSLITGLPPIISGLISIRSCVVIAGLLWYFPAASLFVAKNSTAPGLAVVQPKHASKFVVLKYQITCIAAAAFVTEPNLDGYFDKPTG